MVVVCRYIDGGGSIVSVVSLGLALFLESKNPKDGALILANRTLSKMVATIAATNLMATGNQDTIHLSFAANDALQCLKNKQKQLRVWNYTPT